MKIYNTLTRKKEELETIEPGKVRMYVCGPTVYNLIHIGNARPMIVFDTVRRYLEYRGYEVRYVSNFTDVDDKIIKKAQEEGVSTEEISTRYIAECKKDMSGMNVRPATVHPLATQEIDGMIELISTLLEKGYAYVAADGTVYYRTRKFADYGKLSHKNLDELQAGHRDIKVSGDGKEDELDFVLWKPKKEGEPYWDSPWCEGRPGWHTECSVMAKKYLGAQIDIHAGGEDLIFPHHENEIAQSEAANGVPFARYWMHNGFLNIDNKKMSKSLGNFFTVREIAEKYDLQTLRFFMLAAHYRSPLNFSAELMEAAKNGLERILTAAGRLRDIKAAQGKAAPDQPGAAAQGNTAPVQPGAAAQGNTAPVQPGAAAQGNTAPVQPGAAAQGEAAQAQALIDGAAVFTGKFQAAMDDDVNTADAVAAIFELVKYANTNLDAASPAAAVEAVYGQLFTLCDVLGIVIEKEEEILDSEIEAMIAKRQAARKEKDFARADEIRARLLEKGIILEDTREGVKWKRA